MRYSNKYYIYLLDSKNNKENTRVDKEANNLSAILWVSNSTERNSYKSRGESTKYKNNSNIVYLLYVVYERDSRVRVLIREYKEVDSYIDSTSIEVNIEYLSLTH